MTPLYGITIDDCSNLSKIVAALKELPFRPTARVVFDWNKSKPEPASSYLKALEAIHPVANVMGELLDSSYEKPVTTAEFSAMVESYLATVGNYVDIWEIGNECNGNWTGPYATVAANIEAAFQLCHGAGKKTAITLYFNPNNVDGSKELTPVTFTEQYVSADVRAGVDYVFLSWYPTQFKNYQPTNAILTALFQQLVSLYPNAQVGFGELGTPDKVSAKTLAAAEQIMAHYYALPALVPQYCGGYFWWNWVEDCLGAKALLANQIEAAFNAEAAALS